MKRNTGRPVKVPTTERSTVTMKIDAKLKNLIIEQSQAYGMTITEYFTMLVERDVGR
jgi:antitoxin component of RelBE/YafQ-DinJ toxin-antitoxin module